jgi:hypothetical protein
MPDLSKIDGHGGGQNDFICTVDNGGGTGARARNAISPRFPAAVNDPDPLPQKFRTRKANLEAFI